VPTAPSQDLGPAEAPAGVRRTTDPRPLDGDPPGPTPGNELAGVTGIGSDREQPPLTGR
jgi:hypothetical protein